MKILLVDDSKAMRMLVRRSLREAGYGDATIVEAENGDQGFHTAVAEKPDLILSDWNMPVANGIDFLRRLRSQGNNFRFGFVTSEGTSEMRDIASQAGARFLIAKPFTAEKFEEALAAEFAR